jgi:ABC-type oligopeptide transport system substrate-binding subunit
MSFNVRRRPMNDCAFRQAVTALIDKEFVSDTILQGTTIPVYSFIPEANAAWYSDDVLKIGQGLDREQRLNLAIALLEQAGYSWQDDQKPSWDATGNSVLPGGHLIMPDGTPVPTLQLWAPSAGYDSLRTTFAIWTETWLDEFGIPVEANLAGFNTLIPRIFTEQDFDMYILGWSLSLFPSSLNDFFTTEQAVPDGNNAGGYSNPEFDALSAELLTCDTPESCKTAADRLQQILSTEVPYVLLFTTPIIEAYRSDTISYPYDDSLSGLQYSHLPGLNGGGLQSVVNVE